MLFSFIFLREFVDRVFVRLKNSFGYAYDLCYVIFTSIFILNIFLYRSYEYFCSRFEHSTYELVPKIFYHP